MRPIVYACLAATLAAVAGCSASAPSSTPRVTAPAVTPSATARASVADLKSAALANELDGSDGETIATDAAASGSAKLASDGEALLSDAKTWHDYYGEAAGDQAGNAVVTDLDVIGAICGDG